MPLGHDASCSYAGGYNRMNELPSLYRDVLSAEVACDQATQEDAFRLRYQVYCLERGFEDASAFPEAMETDPHDTYARHFVVRSRDAGLTLGASRLVLDSPPGVGLPIETHGSRSVTRHIERVRSRESTKLAEVSRLAVTRCLPTLIDQRAVAPAPVPFSESRDCCCLQEGPTVPRLPIRSHHVSMGLLALQFQQSWSDDVTHWVALLDQGLLRFLKRVGIHCQPIGPVLAHRGSRQPVMGVVSDVWSGVRKEGVALARLVEQLGDQVATVQAGIGSAGAMGELREASEPG